MARQNMADTITDEDLGQFEKSVVIILLSIMLMFLARTCYSFARGAANVAATEDGEVIEDDEDFEDEEDLHSD
jgi:hypothetical protein